ncbi:hypothetical protein [Plantactinospora sonchi]|uniref:Secreted protein n=1 Tax=Plantactinospora sonchi TaxID=1544735 RepID=A0ABU7RRA0_9ACTN
MVFGWWLHPIAAVLRGAVKLGHDGLCLPIQHLLPSVLDGRRREGAVDFLSRPVAQHATAGTGQHLAGESADIPRLLHLLLVVSQLLLIADVLLVDGLDLGVGLLDCISNVVDVGGVVCGSRRSLLRGVYQTVQFGHVRGGSGVALRRPQLGELVAAVQQSF